MPHYKVTHSYRDVIEYEGINVVEAASEGEALEKILLLPETEEAEYREVESNRIVSMSLVKELTKEEAEELAEELAEAKPPAEDPNFAVRAVLNDLLDWEATTMGGFDAPCWERAREFRDSLFPAEPSRQEDESDAPL